MNKGTATMLLLLLSMALLLVASVHATGLPDPGAMLADSAQFWQGVLNKTMEGNKEQAFSMVLSKVSDDLSGAMRRINGFLESVRRNVTAVLQEGTKNKDTIPVDGSRK